jgi:hypothetical protein
MPRFSKIDLYPVEKTEEPAEIHSITQNDTDKASDLPIDKGLFAIEYQAEPNETETKRDLIVYDNTDKKDLSANELQLQSDIPLEDEILQEPEGKEQEEEIMEDKLVEEEVDSLPIENDDEITNTPENTVEEKDGECPLV